MKKRYITIVILLLIAIIGTVFYNLTREESFVQQIKGAISNYNANGTVQTVKLDENGGTFPSSYPQTLYVDSTGVFSNANCTTAISKIGIPTKSGYKFRGYWRNDREEYIDENGNLDTALIVQIRNAAPSASPTIVARWNKIVSVALDKGGGTGGTNSLYTDGEETFTDSTCTSANRVTSITIPTKSGYKFKGYKTSAGTTIINENGSINQNSLNADYTGYSGNTISATAQWEKIQTITLNRNGGSGGPAAIYVIGDIVYSNANGTGEITSITPPTKSGYKFIGYGSEVYSNGTINVNAIRSNYTGKNGENYEITAQWEQEQTPVTPTTQTITLNDNGGQGGSGAIYVRSGTIYSNSNCSTATVVVDIPTRAGYKFLGYKPDSSSSRWIDENGRINTTAVINRYNNAPSSNYEMTAEWEVEPTIQTITLDKNGGQGGLDRIYVNGRGAFSDSNCTQIITQVTTPTRQKHNFAGYKIPGTDQYYIDWRGIMPMQTILDKYNDSKENYTLIAEWTKELRTVTINPGEKTVREAFDEEIDILENAIIPTITYNYNYSGSNNNSQKLDVVKWEATTGTLSPVQTGGKLTQLLYRFGDTDGTVTLEFGNATLPTATREGYKFLGWYTQPDGGTQAGIAGEVYKPTSNVTLYAHWEKVETTVKVIGVTVAPTTANIYVKGTIKLTATVNPDNATIKNVKWSSNDDSVATVSDTGMVTGNKAGTATITATTEDGNKTATAVITVKEGNTSEDKTKPVIEKVEERNKIIYITVTDEGGIKNIKVNGKDITDKVTSDGRYYYELEGEGDYVVTVEDNAGNVTEKTFTWKDGNLGDKDNPGGNGGNSGDNNNPGGNGGNTGDNNNPGGNGGNTGDNNNPGGNGGNTGDNNNPGGNGGNTGDSNNPGGNGSNSGNSGNLGNNGGSGTNGSLGNSSGLGSSSSKSQMQSSNIKDSTMTNYTLPKTGTNMYIIIGVICAIVFGIFSIIKYRKLREIK